MDHRLASLAFAAISIPALLARDDFPIIPDDLEVSLYAREPLVRNPCAIAFDAQGRLCVGMGPQYRKPTPETPGDSVWILIDADGDGTADSRKRYATGFNSIQGLAWRGRDLYVANAPELTIARDLDGDDEADEYIRLYTDLGNLEHGLHGLNFGPDGKLYMSKGNSKGMTRPPDRVAPRPFRELWGVAAPEAPDFPSPVVFAKGTYRKNFHDPADDWGLCGGILRCDPDGSGLEIVSRGFRNPWDICFDDEFNWLGTDNDQTQGDKLFSPFYGAHFGWGHTWAYDWKGDDHLPTAPSAGPLFEGSGTGVVYCGLEHYPGKYRDIFLVNDWLRREVYIYRPVWKGARMVADRERLEIFAHAGGGRAMGRSAGRRFDPVDIELGPDGAIYISSWGREYGLAEKNGKQVNEGRIYRFWPKGAAPDRSALRDPKRQKPIGKWTVDELYQDLGSHLPAWRTNAQEELLRRGPDAPEKRPATLPKTTRFTTWHVWTMARQLLSPGRDTDLFSNLRDSDSPGARQLMRVLAHRARHRGSQRLPEVSRQELKSADARRRHEAILAIRQAGETRWNKDILDLLAVEQDRVVYYSAWGALMDLATTSQRKTLLRDPRPATRRGVFLSLLEEDSLSDAEIHVFLADQDQSIAALARTRLGGRHTTEIRGPALKSKPRTAPEAASDPRPVSVVSAIHSRKGMRYEEAVLRRGARAYTDRPYRILTLPDEFEGLTFIRAANNDADLARGPFLKLNLRHDSEVLLADDTRGDKLPGWARGTFSPTQLALTTDDSTHRIFRAEFPAGEVTFGPNMENVNGRKANYLVIIRPKLLAPPEQPTTESAALALMEKGNADRGRTLYLSKSGADCARCHRLEGIGNVFAPDLSEIETRAKATFIVRSILSPGADITEGFALQVVRTNKGESLAGIVLEETARTITLALMNGTVRVVDRKEIASQETAPTSAMPPIFGHMLTAQDVADLTTYLLSRKDKVPVAQPPNPRPAEQAPTGKPPQDRASQLSGKQWGERGKGFSLVCHDAGLEISYDGLTIGTYYYRHPETRRPFFAHLKTPGGAQVTRNFPPVKGVDATDHATMHPGLSLGFANFEGVSFWHNTQGIVVQDKFLAEPSAGETAAWSVENRWIGPGGREMCRETAHYAITRNNDGFLLTLDSRLSSPKPFWLGVREEMGLAMRVATPLTVNNKGRILNASGGKNEKGTWGKHDQWWDYFGPLSGKSAGIQIMSAPDNPPVWSHSRDYGVLVANPLPVDTAENRGKRVTIKPGEEFRLRFGIQIHEHDQRHQYDPKAAYKRYLKKL